MSALNPRAEAARRTALFTPAAITMLTLIVVPLLIMAYISLLDRGVNGGVDWQSKFNFGAYKSFLFEEDLDGQQVVNIAYLKTFLRSISQAFFTTFFCFLLGFPVALWMSTLDRRWRETMVLLITIPFWTNLLIRNYAWLIILREDGLAQHMVNAAWPGHGEVQLLYTDFAVSVGLVYSFLPFMILPIYARLEKFDWRLVEAAYDLGANRLRTLIRVIFPLAIPGITAGSLLVFIPSLGAYVTPALLGGGKTLMIGNLIQLQFGPSRNWPFGGALSLILLGIMMLVLMVYAYQRTRRSRKNGEARL